MTRRELLSLGGVVAATAAFRSPAPAETATPPDFTLTLTEATIDLGHGRTTRTVTYDGKVPGPLLRMVEGREIAVDVINQTREPEMVHWHGYHIPPEVDGAHEEGTPMVQAKDRRRFVFTPQPTGTRWYHAHAAAGHKLNRGSYTGQFGMAIIEARSDPGRYDLEVPIILHEWDPFFSSDMNMDVDYQTFTINGRMLGSGEPVRVKRAQRVLFRILNASATMQHRLALPAHVFEVIALDGNPVANRIKVPVLELWPGERVDAIVEMTSPGIWVLGEEDARQRREGAGIVVEYAGATGAPRWARPPKFIWDYTVFGAKAPAPDPASTVPLVFEPGSNGYLWAINGKSYPNTDPFFVAPGARNRLVFDNRSDMAHPVHLHRHTFEITRFAGKQTSGVFKDVVLVPSRSTVEVDLTPNTPGPSLFHCHQQFHMDFGFMALMQYRTPARQSERSASTL
jgi:FtsP/CotA-like multicopper oxidase with cupredoxin domain